MKLDLKKAPKIVFRIIRKIPRVLWVMAALLGILIFGYFAGVSVAYDPTSNAPNQAQQLKIENDTYADLIRGYEKLNDLFSVQGQDLSILMDKETILSSPALFSATLNRMTTRKDMILLQQGRILELRKSANLPENSEIRQN